MQDIKPAPEVYIHPVHESGAPRTLPVPLPVLIGAGALIAVAILAFFLFSGPEDSVEKGEAPVSKEPAEASVQPPVEPVPAPAPAVEVQAPPAPESSATQPVPTPPVSEPTIQEAPSEWATHKAAAGESLPAIFGKLGLSPKLLAQITKHPVGNILTGISPGQLLKVKGGSKDGFDQMIWEKGPGESLVITGTGQGGYDYQSTVKAPKPRPKPAPPAAKPNAKPVAQQAVKPATQTTATPQAPSAPPSR
ncbi:MAG: hypothetical protein A2514_03910 [Gammaproteobacteria bacterium RIFOXYD12_FULL_61_37]|nr:MAG: hypothetical protein A2514_03910 [Gammaproteobacteria bacterium RIFOXYD12_FULL_61_37]